MTPCLTGQEATQVSDGRFKEGDGCCCDIKIDPGDVFQDVSGHLEFAHEKGSAEGIDSRYTPSVSK